MFRKEKANVKTIFDEARKALLEHSYFVLASPENPDIDSISSVCAFRFFLKWFHPYCATWLYCPDPLTSLKENPLLGFIDGADAVQTTLPFWHPNCIVLFDYGDIARVQLPKLYDDVFTIGFDHHSQVGRKPELVIVDKTSPSCTALLFRFFKFCAFPWKGNAASRALLAGLIADTGRFSNPAVNIEALKIAVALDMKDMWFSKMMLASRRSISLKRLKIWMQLVPQVLRSFDSKSGFIFCSVGKRRLQELDATRRDIFSFFGFMQDIEGVRIAAMIIENEDGSLRVVLRPGPSLINVEPIAKEFGGGGHPYAAGFTWRKDLKTLLGQLQKIACAIQ